MVNLAGELYMNTSMSPFRVLDRFVDEAAALTETIVVDIHGEATSEKVAMGHYLDGRATAVVGTQTHVETSDARVLPGRHRLPQRRWHEGSARVRHRGPHGHHPAALPH